MKLLFFAIVLFLLGSVIGARLKKGFPRFKWLKDYKSDHGVPLLNIKFPDKQEDDFAVLKQIQGRSASDCILTGNLMIQKNVSITVTKGCELENTFKVEFDSHRLAYSIFEVDGGIVRAIIPENPKVELTNEIEWSMSGPNPILQFPPNGFVLKLIAYFDTSFHEKFEVLSKLLVETIVQRAQDSFALPSLTTNISLDLVEVRQINFSIIAEQDSLIEVGEECVRNGNSNIDAYIFFADENHDGIDGISNIGKICSQDFGKKVAIVEWSKEEGLAATARTCAHELGHLLGMEHDFVKIKNSRKTGKRLDSSSKSCTSIGGIMDYESNRTVWTTCSLHDFLTFFDSVKTANSTFCLEENKPQENGFSKVAVALGTTNSGSSLDNIEVIDLSSPNTRCKNLPNFPIQNYDAAGVLGFQNVPMICGGENLGTGCYSLDNGRWRPSESLLESRTRFAMTKSPFTTDDSRLFVTGGNSLFKLNSNSSEVLTPTGWKPSKALPVGVHAHCMVSIGPTLVMVISGFQEKRSYNFLFNSTQNRWTKRPGLMNPRSDHSCAMIARNNTSNEKSIIVVAGEDLTGQGLLTSTEILDNLYSVWRSGPELPLGLFSPALVEDGSGGVILIGGSDLNLNPRNSIYRLAHADAKWEEMPQKLLIARDSHTAFMIPNELASCS